MIDKYLERSAPSVSQTQNEENKMKTWSTMKATCNVDLCLEIKDCKSAVYSSVFYECEVFRVCVAFGNKTFDLKDSPVDYIKKNVICNICNINKNLLEVFHHVSLKIYKNVNCTVLFKTMQILLLHQFMWWKLKNN